eukprot:3574822-Rhodomonas_salina.2
MLCYSEGQWHQRGDISYIASETRKEDEKEVDKRGSCQCDSEGDAEAKKRLATSALIRVRRR